MPGQSGPGSNGNGTSQSDCLVSYPGPSLGDLTPQQRCSQCILQPQPTGQTTTWGQSEPGNNVNEGVLRTRQCYRAGASQPDAV